MSRYNFSDRDDINAVLSGIHELDSANSLLDTRRRAQIEELILTLKYSDPEAERSIEILSSISSTERPDLKFAEERLAECRKFISVFGISSLPEYDFGTELQKKSEFLVGMLENRYSEAAFSHFSSNLTLNKAYFQSFEDICESIVGGSCDFGIIPTESSDSGKLIRFYSLIEQYDLKINAVTDIEYQDNSASTRYALVSRDIDHSNNIFPDPDFLEFTVNLADASLLGEILHAAALCGMALQRVDSIPIPYKEREFLFCPVFNIKNAETDAFLLYMYLDFPQYTPIGIFKKL